MSQVIANDDPLKAEQSKKSDQEIANEHFEELFREHQECREEIQKYQEILKEFHMLQDKVDKKCQEHFKNQKKAKEMLKRLDLSEEEKRTKMEALHQYGQESKLWKSVFPAKSTGILKLFIGTANIRMLKPAERQNYKYVCFS